MRVQRHKVTIGTGGALKWGGALEPKELADEWVLRELGDANLDDDAAVAELLARDGTLAWPYFQPGYVPVEHHVRITPWPPVRHADWWRTQWHSTIEDARWWLRTARALAGTWRESQFGGDPFAPWLAEGFLASPLHDPDAGGWPQFAAALNVGLEPFRAHVEPTGGDEPTVGLYAAACRQIFNLMVSDGTARRCESATCGRVFVRQRGDIEYRQHYRTTGVRFCSEECMRAEKQRRYRRRKAKEREQGQ